MSETILNMKGIYKAFGEKQVLEDLNFSVDRGTITGLVGANGAGKSTLIKCLLGILKPDGGESSVCENPSWNLTGETKSRIGYVPQVLTGFKWMKVKALLDYTAAFYPRWNTGRVNSLLNEWRLDPDAKISKLSEGEKQKLSIIKALGHEPDILILDEPVASLDPAARRNFIKKLIDMNSNENKTMLFSTHIMSDLERVAADIAFLKGGKISYRGDLSDLKDRIRRVHFQSKTELPAVLPLKNIINCQKNRTSATVTVEGLSDDEIQKTAAELGAFITVERLNLEEIFLELNK